MRFYRFLVPAAALLGGSLWLGSGGRWAAAAEARKTVIPFDFVSKFDQGRYGRTVGEMIWTKLEREGGFIIPETMLDVRDTCKANDLHPSPELPPEKMAKIVREDFGAHIGIFGSVERAPGQDRDVYDLVIRCVDFTAYPEPKMIYHCAARTKTVSEIPHLYVRQMLDALYGRKPAGPPPVDPLAERKWKENPNLVKGDFQQGARGVPAGWASGWEAGEVNQWEPLGKTVRWIGEDGDSTNRLIRFTLRKPLGDTTGVAYYSEFFPVEEGAKYRFQCRWRSNGPKPIVLIKCYDRIGTPYRGKPSGPSARGTAARDGYVPKLAETREVYRSQQNLEGPQKTWNTQTQDFTPRHTEYTPRWGRVMLYAYLGAGAVEFDDVVVKQIVPASPGGAHQDPRHSLETKVTVKQMQENDRRSREAKEKRERDKQGKP